MNLAWAILFPPYSVLFLTVLALGISAGTILLNRRLIDYEKMRRNRQIVKEYTELKRKALLSGDKKLERKVEKMTPAYQRAQMEISRASFRPLLYTTIPMLLIFWALRGIYYEVPVVRLPFEIPMIDMIRKTVFSPDVVGYLGYYIMASYFFTLILQRIAGTSLD